MKMKKSQKIVAELEKQKISHKAYFFRGHCLGKAKGFPQKVGEYPTVTYGSLDKFYVGEPEVFWNEDLWVLLYEFHSEGDPYTPSVYRAIYVPKKFWKKAKEIIASI